MTPPPGAMAWMGHCACARPAHRGLPWLDDTHNLPPVLVDLMRDVCVSCPVFANCAGYAATTDVTGGFWAGFDRDSFADVVQMQLDDLLEPDLLESDDLGGAA